MQSSQIKCVMVDLYVHLLLDYVYCFILSSLVRTRVYMSNYCSRCCEFSSQLALIECVQENLLFTFEFAMRNATIQLSDLVIHMLCRV